MNWFKALMNIGKVKGALIATFDALIKAAVIVKAIAAGMTDVKYRKIFENLAKVLDTTNAVLAKIITALGGTVELADAARVKAAMSSDDLEKILKDLEKIKI